MNLLLDILFELRLVALFLIGAGIGGQLNRAVYAWSWRPRPISPWSAAPRGVAARRWRDRLPILGWFLRRDESAIFGRGYWLRPMLVEFAVGLGMAALYAWEVDGVGLLAHPLPRGFQPASDLNIQVELHSAYLSHVLLGCLMMIAALIDVDEKIIPDQATLPGTLCGLVLAWLLPASLLPERLAQLPNGQFDIWPLWASYPDRAFAFAGGPGAAWVGMAIFLAWCLALLPRHWRTRRGYGLARKIFFARIAREPSTKYILGMALVGCLAIFVLGRHGGRHWLGLLTALIGLAGSGGLVWAVRIIAGTVLRKEAMGFGDVTLMAMIGAFLGWQAALLVFFLAPFAGLVLGGLQWLLKRDNEIPYGPFLCLAAAVVVVAWADLWQRVHSIFQQGWLAPGVVAGCMVLLAVLLGLLQLGRRLFLKSG